jgi:methyl-accepting chemotaxis protein
MEEISSSMIEQTAVSREIGSNVDRVARVAQEISVPIGHAEQEGQQLQALATELNGVLNRFKL